MSPSRGLEDVVAGKSSITFIDGVRGRLLYRGYDIKDLVENSNYEEVAYLLWKRSLPNSAELSAFSADLAGKRHLPPEVDRTISSLSRDCDTMDAVEMAIAALGIYDDHSFPLQEEAASIASKIGTIVTHLHRHKSSLTPLKPRDDMSFASNFLYMMTGGEPDSFAEKVMNTILVLHADHELNASTFTARVVASTLSDIYSSVTAAVAALKGPLHGGANERVVEMVEEIGSAQNVEDYLRAKLAKKEKVMGFGHRVYKTDDPRASILRSYVERLVSTSEEKRDFEVLESIRSTMLREKNLHPNLDFYSGFILHHLGIPTAMFTPVFAVGRTPGWLAHIMEQYADNRIMRPIADYVGATELAYVPISLRDGQIPK